MSATETVYELQIPAGGVGFITAVANNYFLGVEWDWMIDDARVEPNPIQRQLGLVNMPKRYDPPLLVKNKITVTAYNGAREDVELEWLCDGLIYVRSD
jgi:hypothetical protein